MSINRVCVTGNLTRDPELKTTQGGMAILQLGVAVNDRRKNASGEWEDVPSFFTVVVFGKRAESLSRFLGKGSKVAVEGKLRSRSWEASDGTKRTAVEIVADGIEFMSKSDGSSGRSRREPDYSDAMPTNDYDDDSIPF